MKKKHSHGFIAGPSRHFRLRVSAFSHERYRVTLNADVQSVFVNGTASPKFWNRIVSDIKKFYANKYDPTKEQANW